MKIIKIVKKYTILLLRNIIIKISSVYKINLRVPISKLSAAYKGNILYFTDDPVKTPSTQDSYRYIENGLLIIKDGIIVAVDEYSKLKDKVKMLTGKNTIITTFENRLIMPGFIDSHIHYPQTEMIGAYGRQLLEWLNTYAFPTEKKYKQKNYAKKMAKIFLKELLRNGTTTALVFATVHEESVNALFEEAHKLNMRLITGKVMMDRNAPDYLLDTAESSYNDTKKLIKKWHGKGRLLYAITPRFAHTSTPKQLNMAKKLKQEFPGVYIHTHLSENIEEIKWVRSLFPKNSGYLDVYNSYNLTSSKSIFAHSIHLSEKEFKILHDTKSAVAFCPTSNLFLGSGLFKLREAKKNGREVKVGMGTDIGSGTTFNMLETLSEAYKVVMLQQNNLKKRIPLSAFEGFYQATLGSARALELEDKIGTFAPGMEADFIVIDWNSTALQKLRISQTDIKFQNKELTEEECLEDKLFVLMTMGDDRNITATYINGKPVHFKRNGKYINSSDFSAVTG